MKKVFIISGFAVVVIILVLLKIFVLSPKKAKAPAVAANAAIPAECYVVRDTAVDYRVETVGSVHAREQVDIVSEIARKVVSIPMKEGAAVKAGQLLFRLDGADISARINKLKIELEFAASNEARDKVLLSKGGLSQEKFDESSNRRRTLQAEIDVLKVDLAKTEIRAPFSGRIGLRTVSEGALVTPGMVLANLQDVSRVKIDFSVPERYSRDLHAGSQISYRTDYLAEERTAAVEAIEPAVDQRTRTLLVRADADNKDASLVPGTSARISLTVTEARPGIFVPTSALIPSIKGYTVFVKHKGAALGVTVKTGVRNNENIQILEGLKAGDSLITTNLLRIKNGSPVTIVKTY